MRYSHYFRTFPLIAALFLPALLTAYDSPINPAPPKGATPEEIIARFAAKEKEFKSARDHYTYRQDTKVQTLDGDTVNGEYQEVVDIVFDDKGRRTENVILAPQNTLVGVTMTKEDYDDIRNRLPFVLTSDELGQYQILYVGQQKVDELDTYVFDVAPKTMDKGKRYFQGRIWVDDRDLQIVKTEGKNVPDVRPKNKRDENLSPKFTTYREQVDKKYWFPTYTRADDELHFSSGDIHIREIVKYTNYKRFGSDVKVIFEGQEIKGPEDQDHKPEPQATPQNPQAKPKK